MKKLLVFTIAALLLAGCATTANPPAAAASPETSADMPAATPKPQDALTTPGSETQEAAGPIQIYIKQKTVTTATEEVTLVIINSSDKTYSYDYVQKLERRKADGTWEKVELTNEAVSLALLVIPAGETQEQAFDFKNHFEPLTRGTYRIVKTFVNEADGAIDVTCEFDAL